MNDLKVIGVGFRYTGINRLRKCMEILGYKGIRYERLTFALYHESEIQALLKMMEHFDFVGDWPWLKLAGEVYEAFPDSKFILTTNINSETWFKHLAKLVHTRASIQTFIPEYSDIHKYKDFHIKSYEDHNAEVRKFFADKPGSLLEVCWDRGDGWKELTEFLNVKIPAMAFPNSTLDNQAVSTLKKGSFRKIMSTAVSRIFKITLGSR